VKQVAPDKPWFCYLAPGANHAPHHAPKEWIEKYRGSFDMGYERYREIVLERMKERGIVPQQTELSAINPWPAPEVILEGDLVKPWDSLSADEQRLFARMAEVYAGFCSYTDHEIGRLLDYLEESGQLENTIVVAVSDNGASGEGSPVGSVNENKFFNGWPEDPEENMRKLDELGSPSAYNHYPTGWAWAFNAPYKMFKRYVLEGGIADPLIISWPKRIADAGGIRDQYHHAIDVVPTILELAGIEPPDTIGGHAQSPIQGVSMAYTFADPAADSRRPTQYYAMLGTRAIYHHGWKAVARHGAISGRGRFMEDEWELYNVAEDRAEVHDLAAEQPEKVQELIATWFAYAGRNNAFPLDDRTALEQLMSPRPSVSTPRDEYVYYPGTSPVPEGAAVNVRNRSFDILAELDVRSPNAEGVLYSMGSRFGGQVIYIKDGRLSYAYNFLGIEEFRFSAETSLPTGKVVVGAEFTKEREEPRGVANGTLKLYVGDDVVAEGPMRSQPGKFGLGEGICVGRSGPDPVVDDYQPPFGVKGAKLERLRVNVSGEHYVDLETEALAMLARE
jgi:arylsulfatase A-like enzyme